MSYQVLARKWRPRLFKDMVGQDHVLKVLVNALDSDRLHHAYLFTGTRGVGTGGWGSDQHMYLILLDNTSIDDLFSALEDAFCYQNRACKNSHLSQVDVCRYKNLSQVLEIAPCSVSLFIHFNNKLYCSDLCILLMMV